MIDLSVEMDGERLSFCCFQYLQSTVLLTRKHHFDYFKSNTIEIWILVKPKKQKNCPSLQIQHSCDFTRNRAATKWASCWQIILSHLTSKGNPLKNRFQPAGIFMSFHSKYLWRSVYSIHWKAKCPFTGIFKY